MGVSDAMFSVFGVTFGFVVSLLSPLFDDPDDEQAAAATAIVTVMAMKPR
jgi:hypothetical protein